MVLGDRLSSTYFTENDRIFHNSGNKLIRRLLNSIFGSNLHDILTGYRSFSRQFVRNTVLLSTGFEVETELTEHALSSDFSVKEVVVPYKHRPVNSKSKLNTFRDGSLILKTLFLLFRDYKPMKFFGIIATVTAFSALVLLTPVFIDYFHTGLVERFPTLIFGCFVLLCSILLFCCGLTLQVITNQNRRTIRHINRLREDLP